MKANIVNIKDINSDDIVNMLNKKSFVMAIPTDTVYALCCNANDEDAVAKIYSLKNREKDKPISLFIKSLDELDRYVMGGTINTVGAVSDNLYNNTVGAFIECPYTEKKNCTGEYLQNPIIELLNKYWPGALTVIFKKKKNIYDYLTSGKDTIGIRIPDDKLLLDILAKVDFPLAQTSCNMSHEKELKNAKEIYDKFGDKVDLIIETNADVVGKASTIISVENRDIKVLRQGDIKL